MGTRNLRTAPFGQPPKGNRGTENEVLNPGRYQYCAASSMGYYNSVVDPWTLIWIDELANQTPEVLYTPGDPTAFDLPADYNYPQPRPFADTEPDYDNGWAINRKNTWQSGPPENIAVSDNAIPGAGYWTKKGGPNSAGSKEPGFEIYTKNHLPVQLFNMGHGNIASESGSAETNVIGWDGYLKWDGQGVIESTTDCNIGIPHAYAMYTLDMSIAALQQLIEKLQDWVEENKDPDDGSTEGGRLSRMLFPGPEVRAPSVKVVIRIIKMIKKIIEQANSDGVIGGLLVNWDFICELSVPTEANEYKYPPDHMGNPGNGGKYSHGKGGPHGPERFSYIISEIDQAFVQLLNMRANGVLWHITSEAGGARYRICRTFNFAHIHSMSITDRLDHRFAHKFEQVLSYWHKDLHPDAILDKSRRIDHRG